MIATESLQPCALPGCTNPVPAQAAGARHKRDYCSNACWQKAYRDRHHLIKRNTQIVMFWEQAADAIEHLTQVRLASLKQSIDAKLGISTTTPPVERPPLDAPVPSLKFQSRQPAQPQRAAVEQFCLRKGKGAIHLALNHYLTLCGKDASPMQAEAYREEHLCQRCCTIRDTQTWWQGWREALDAAIYQTSSG